MISLEQNTNQCIMSSLEDSQKVLFIPEDVNIELSKSPMKKKGMKRKSVRFSEAQSSVVIIPTTSSMSEKERSKVWYNRTNTDSFIAESEAAAIMAQTEDSKPTLALLKAYRAIRKRKENNRAIELLKVWCHGTEVSYRGLESVADLDMAEMILSSQSNHCRRVLLTQRRIFESGRKVDNDFCTMLCEVSENGSKYSRDFARLIGEADADIIKLEQLSETSSEKPSNVSEQRRVPSWKNFKKTLLNSVNSRKVMAANTA